MKADFPTKETLQAQWGDLYGANTPLKAIRITATSIPDLFIGLDENLNRLLILYHTIDKTQNITPVKKVNLSLESHSRQLLIRLENTFFEDLFDDLITSIYFKTSNTVDQQECISEFVSAFNKWSAFFQNATGDRLSEMTIIGLFGELELLKHLIKSNEDTYEINDLLVGWRGPYDLSHDFVLNDTDIEVKTVLRPNIDIHISSEFQLAAEFGKPLKLAVIGLERDFANGYTIAKLIEQVQQEVLNRGGNFLIIIEALHQKGLSKSNIRDYDNYLFRRERIQFFDCMDESFPKIIKEQLPSAINNLKYNLRLSGLQPFLTEEISD